jgi:hypothetical protein
MVTHDTFVSFLNCKRKAFLKAAGEAGDRSAFEEVHLGLARVYEQRALAKFLAPYDPADVLRDPPALQEAMKGWPRVIVNGWPAPQFLVHPKRELRPYNISESSYSLFGG